MIPAWLAPKAPKSLMAQAGRLLEGGRVEQLTWFRGATTARVIAPNGRSFETTLVGRAEALDSSRCTCTPGASAALCVHRAALLVELARRAGADAALWPGLRFEASPWRQISEVLDGAGAGRAQWQSTELGACELSVEGRVLGGWRGEVPPLRSLSPLGWAEWVREHRSVAMRRLRDLVLTADERELLRLGRKTHQLQQEDAPTWWLAAWLFDEVECGRAAVRAEVGDGNLRVVVALDGGEVWLALLGAAVDRLEHRCPGLLAAWGLPVAAARASARLRLQVVDGALEFRPVVVLDDGDTAEVISDDIGAIKGRLCVVHGRREVFPVEVCSRPFRVAEAAPQTLFDSTPLGSALGFPLDRPTVVPAAEAGRFLARFADELATWPLVLRPALLDQPPQPPDRGRLELELIDGGLAARITLGVGADWVEAPAVARARRADEGLMLLGRTVIDPTAAEWGWLDRLSWRPDGAVHLAPIEACRLVHQLPEQLELAGEPEAIAAFERLSTLTAEAGPPDAEALGLSLYDFQVEGYRWLWNLWRYGVGGLLADDMGLGKTHQALALVAAVWAGARPKPRILIVAPASVVPHWASKIGKLLPEVPVIERAGAARSRAAGIVLLSYGVARNDAEQLAAVSKAEAEEASRPGFDLVIFDEAHVLKNPSSQTHRELAKIPARVAIGLTGTPIENSVSDLASLLSLVAPGYLPPPAAFERLYGEPIAAGDAGARAALARLVRPLVVRRVKAEVLDGLPAKIEDRRTCRLTVEQRGLYQALLASDPELFRELGGSGPIRYLHVFALLQRLKMLCDHPDLLDPEGSPPTDRSSGKWELLLEILDEAMASGLKVVVFSQYLRMLDRIGAHLASRGIAFAEIRGATRDRARPVRRFQEDPGCRVFLASLGAGGVGIDLTAASVVIHYDRWWHRAKEDQATDRVHRIGQQRGVQVFTFVTEDTIEERIDHIIARKAELAADLLPEDGAGDLVERLGREELREVLGLRDRG
jgi:superfamily II DNA or RNA helicase